MTSLYPKPGDRVVILEARHYRCFWHRKLPIYGRVLYRRGGECFVRPMWGESDHVIGYYNDELVVANRGCPKLPKWAMRRPRKPLGS
jgi:hypothetical protein